MDHNRRPAAAHPAAARHVAHTVAARTEHDAQPRRVPHGRRRRRRPAALSSLLPATLPPQPHAAQYGLPKSDENRLIGTDTDVSVLTASNSDFEPPVGTF